MPQAPTLADQRAMTRASRLISAREASRRASVPWKDLRDDLEEAGVPIHSIGRTAKGRVRLRIPEDAFEDFIASCTVATRGETQNRADLIERLAAERLGI